MCNNEGSVWRSEATESAFSAVLYMKVTTVYFFDVCSNTQSLSGLQLVVNGVNLVSALKCWSGWLYK